MIKRHIKKIYMFFRHPIYNWYFNIKSKKNFFVRGRTNVKKIKKIDLGKNVTLGYDARINFFNPNDDERLIIGNNTYICNRVTFLVGGDISIGENTLIASDVCIVSENHSIDLKDEKPYMFQKLICKPVNVGSNVWIGEKVMILPGVTIGDNCVIGAGSVVTKNIEKNCIVVGNPAKVIKKYDVTKGEWIRC